eukprot:maker-scaffold25_size650667-snap-gene-1.16 protein:Tk06691 transcript:maker-scaffold25_size650667-snap-gene-1.16-mRNA-1 annotation:"taf5-like rna polymerase ii p300 cbp-associated factor-associated factor 65 kda subunit 5l-like"
MRVKMLKRDGADYLRETKHDIHKVPRHYHPDHHPLASGREYVRALNAVKLERVFAQPFLGSLDGHGDSITALRPHPSRLACLASAAADGEIRFWDLTTRRTLIRAPAHEGFTRGLSFDTSGQTLLSVGDDKTVKFWSTAQVPVEPEPTATLKPTHTLMAQAEGIKRIHHERLLRDEPTQDTNAPDAKFNEIQQVEDTIQAVRSGSAPLPSVCLYRLTSTQSHFTASTISRDARLLGAASEHAGLWAWPLQPPQTGLTVKDEDGPDLVQPATRDIETTGGDESACSRLIGHTGVVYDCAFVPHRTAVAGDPLSNFLLSVGEDTTMRLWDLKTQQNRAVFRGHSYPIWSLDIDRLGINIATGSMDCTAKLWDIEHTFPLRIYAGHERDVDVVQFHPNCNYLATGSLDRSIRLWSHADAQMVRVFSGHRGSIFSLAFSPDGAFLASGGEDHDVRVWDLASASLLKELKGHTEAIYALIWSPDSSMLTSGSLDGSIRHWDIKGPIRSPSDGFGPGMSSELVAAYQTHVSIQSLSYSPHNTLIATGERVMKLKEKVRDLGNVQAREVLSDDEPAATKVS